MSVEDVISEHERAVKEFLFANAGTVVLARYALESTRGEIRRIAKERDGAYRERAQMAVALARLFPSWVDIDLGESDWLVLYVQLPTGQVSWHFSPSDRDLLDGITVGGETWDGHTTEEKYARLAQLSPLERAR